jgi:pyruvate,water dikinase
MHDTQYIQFFDGGHEPTIEILGGKCASLVSMTAAGMPVPPGFAVTTNAYAMFVHESGLDSTIHRLLSDLDPDDVRSVDSRSAAIREEMVMRPVPDELRAQAYLAYHDLMERCGGEVPVAVRSSATAEDLPEASFAGQQDTYLWMSGLDNVTDHIRQCWASLYTSRAITYRLKNGISNDGLSMAVAVQKMVNATASGVAITLHPGTGDRSKITIDASYGVGEMVVSGQVTPDNIMLDKVMLTTVSERLGDKHAELVPDPVAGALVEREVDEERRNRRCLTDEQVIAVAQMAKRAEKHYGCPQDIEFAFDADLPAGQNLLLLQSRPETVHSAKVPEQRSAPAGGSGGFSFSNLSSLAATASQATNTLPGHQHGHSHN